MTHTAAIASPFRWRAFVREEMRWLQDRNPATLAAIKEGIEDYRAGRIEPWSQVKQELELG